MNRRELLGTMGIMAAGGAAWTLPAAAQNATTKTGLCLFDVREHGAVGDGKTLDTLAIRRANKGRHDPMAEGPGNHFALKTA